jgi:uncharacterized protein YggL (DUF469 family)
MDASSPATEAHGCYAAVGKNPEWSVFVTREGRGSATEGHRQAIETWLATRPEVNNVQIGPLVDAWYPT